MVTATHVFAQMDGLPLAIVLFVIAVIHPISVIIVVLLPMMVTVILVHVANLPDGVVTTANFVCYLAKTEDQEMIQIVLVTAEINILVKLVINVLLGKIGVMEEELSMQALIQIVTNVFVMIHQLGQELDVMYVHSIVQDMVLNLILTVLVLVLLNTQERHVTNVTFNQTPDSVMDEESLLTIIQIVQLVFVMIQRLGQVLNVTNV